MLLVRNCDGEWWEWVTSNRWINIRTLLLRGVSDDNCWCHVTIYCWKNFVYPVCICKHATPYTRMYVHMHKRMHAHTRTHIHPPTHTHTHTHTHTQSYILCYFITNLSKLFWCILSKSSAVITLLTHFGTGVLLLLLTLAGFLCLVTVAAHPLLQYHFLYTETFSL